MEPISAGKQVLSDIEQSIQNALSLFNFKDTTGIVSPSYLIDDPIVSLHDPKYQQQNQNIEQVAESQCNNVEVARKSSLAKANYHVDGKECNDESLFMKACLSNESVTLPFLDDPIKSTVEEMQRVLNTKGGVFMPISDPSPEELLNLYSQDLGICLSSNASPRGAEQHTQGSEKTKQNKHDKKSYKKLKQQKSRLNQEKTKEFTKKHKTSKSVIKTTQENRMKDLMNIYGCADTIRKPQSDSTLGSKSGVSRKDSAKKTTHVSKTSSTISKKSKRKDKRNPTKYDVELSNGEFTEKSSRLSAKIKNKQRLINAKLLKKPSFKGKAGVSVVNNTVEPKLNKNHQTQYKDSNYSKHKISNSKYFTKDNSYKEQILSRKSYSTQNKKDNMYSQMRTNTEDDILIGNDKTNLHGLLPHSKHLHKTNKKSIPNSLDVNNQTNFSNSSLLHKQLHTTENEKPIKHLNKKTSDETKLNRHVLFSESTNSNYLNNSHIDNNQFGYDNINEDFIGQQTQLHYALPTQASRSKEVERFLNGHYQYLPFVIGQSTNKSHNLWVNIQEALSLIKQKVPQTSEVPNTVHETDSERPLSVISKSTFKSIKKPHQCPAVQTDGLYDIPEGSGETEEAALKSWEDHPDCIQANLDPNSVRPRCSCVLQPYLSYKKVLRQIFGGGAAIMSETSSDMNGVRDDILQDQGGDSYTTELRKALVSFTQEFEDLNNKYEEYLLDPNVSKEELQRLEKQLENKEEEIREIITRFHEMKEVSEKAQLDGNKSRPIVNSLEAYKSTTSIRLAQTLRRVQQFKESLKCRPSVPYLSKSVHAQGIY